MNVEEYILSGIVEAYVVGNLSDAECAEVERYAEQYPEIRTEIDAVEDTMRKYAELHNMKPSDGLKKKIISSIEDDRQTEPKMRRISLAEEESRDPRNKMIWSIAASVFLMISLTINIYLSSRTINAEHYVHELVRKNIRKDSLMQLVKSENSQMQADISILKDPMYKVVKLKGQSTDTSAKAMVCWCPDNKSVYFEADKMPELPKGMQYQLWAMVDGKPVSEGMITITEGLHKMNDISGATAFAVTMEKEGGSDTPHGNMIMLGNI